MKARNKADFDNFCRLKSQSGINYNFSQHTEFEEKKVNIDESLSAFRLKNEDKISLNPEFIHLWMNINDSEADQNISKLTNLFVKKSEELDKKKQEIRSLLKLAASYGLQTDSLYSVSLIKSEISKAKKLKSETIAKAKVMEIAAKKEEHEDTLLVLKQWASQAKAAGIPTIKNLHLGMDLDYAHFILNDIIKDIDSFPYNKGAELKKNSTSVGSYFIGDLGKTNVILPKETQYSEKMPAISFLDKKLKIHEVNCLRHISFFKNRRSKWFGSQDGLVDIIKIDDLEEFLGTKTGDIGKYADLISKRFNLKNDFIHYSALNYLDGSVRSKTEKIVETIRQSKQRVGTVFGGEGWDEYTLSVPEVFVNYDFDRGFGVCLWQEDPFIRFSSKICFSLIRIPTNKELLEIQKVMSDLETKKQNELESAFD